MTKVKICGLRRLEDVDAANRAVPDFVGFVFAESRRRVDVALAATFRERLDSRIASVGVFVNQDVEFVAALCRDGVISLAQLHGDEDGEAIRRLRERCGCEVIKTVGICDGGGVGVLPALPLGAEYLLFDTASAARGGAGRAFDWRVLAGYQGPPYFLAGGLTAANVAEAIRTLAPFAVDVSSGVETDGVKDAEKIERFVHSVRVAAQP
ncbi:MAG: phosphoribosylanthranilate isomerase [Phycisphaerae bacterium]|nr:phosphoribosylanthranilate isomerase [Phycisphaerae bacterium]